MTSKSIAAVLHYSVPITMRDGIAESRKKLVDGFMHFLYKGPERTEGIKKIAKAAGVGAGMINNVLYGRANLGSVPREQLKESLQASTTRHDERQVIAGLPLHLLGIPSDAELEKGRREDEKLMVLVPPLREKAVREMRDGLFTGLCNVLAPSLNIEAALDKVCAKCRILPAVMRLVKSGKVSLRPGENGAPSPYRQAIAATLAAAVAAESPGGPKESMQRCVDMIPLQLLEQDSGDAPASASEPTASEVVRRIEPEPHLAVAQAGTATSLQSPPRSIFDWQPSEDDIAIRASGVLAVIQGVHGQVVSTRRKKDGGFRIDIDPEKPEAT